MSRGPVRGAALVLVLWLIVLLTAVVGGYALLGRTGHLQGRTETRQLQGDAAARAGLEYAVWRLNHPDPTLRWHPDGRAYHWRYGGAELELRITDERGRVDLNRASPQLLQALLHALGADPARAASQAAAIVDWRDGDDMAAPGGAEDPAYAAAGRPYGAKDAPFESIAELLQVLGIEPADYQRLRPQVTVHSGLPQPEAAFAPLPVLQALGVRDAALLVQLRGQPPRGDAVAQPGDPRPGAAAASVGHLLALAEGGVVRRGTYSIDSLARLPDGSRTTTRAVVRLQGTGAPGMAYMVLAWEEGASPQ